MLPMNYRCFRYTLPWPEPALVTSSLQKSRAARLVPAVGMLPLHMGTNNCARTIDRNNRAVSGRLNLSSLTCLLLACFGLASCASVKSAAVPPPGSMPTITSFTANPTSINSGASATLSWVTSGATSVSVTPGTFTSTSASGSTSVSPTATTTYTLKATNSSGSNTMTATVTVNPVGGAPTITSFTANPTTINSGSSSTLSWVTSGATSIAITPGT